MWILNNLDVIVGLVALVALGVGAVWQFIKLGKEAQIDKVREWLIFATVEAEKALGAKTGQVKLRYCYDMFVDKFKFVALLITFEEFSELVDEALDSVRHMLNTNEKIQEYVKK